MRRDEMADLTAFVVVAEERSFTRAAAKLGLSQSALSQIVRRLEERMGIRLLARTTRSVAPTQAGEHLVNTLAPALRTLDQSVQDLGKYRDKPSGYIRITAVEHAAKTVIAPALAKLLSDYPDITVEVIVDYGLSDIVSDRFDAGVRLGKQVAKDMIAARISPDIPMVVVGSPDYFRNREKPTEPKQLLNHQCINLMLPTSNAPYAWRFTEDGREIKIRVEGPLSFNTIDLIKEAVLSGVGLAYLPTDQVEHHIKNGNLIKVLENCIPSLSGYHLYYPNRRHSTPAFKLFVEALRYRHR